MNQFSQKQWQEYISKTQLQPPHQTCQFAVQHLLKNPHHRSHDLTAVDLGCGAGRDLRFLYDCGFKIYGVDSSQEILEANKSLLNESSKVSLKVIEMENFVWPNESVHLINASASLPFIKPQEFAAFWSRAIQKLECGGVFSGHLFGTHDSWCGQKDFSFFNKESIEQMFKDFEWIHFKESEYDGPSGSEPNKHWHRFDLVAQKNN